MTDLERAKSLLNQQKKPEQQGQPERTCAFVKGDWVYTSSQRGIRPLLACLNQPEKENGFAAADKVIGKAAAFLYVLLGAGEVYAGVISKPALMVLEKAGIKVSYDCLTDAIRNRAGDGFCPMETAVWDISNPQEALKTVLRKLEEMKSAVKEIER